MFPSVEYVRNLINKEALRNATPVVIGNVLSYISVKTWLTN